MNKLIHHQFTVIRLIIAVGLLLAGGVATSLAQAKEGDQLRVRVDITGIPGDGIGGSIEAFGSDQLLSKVGAGDGGASSGKAQFDPVIVTKAIDAATPKLYEACASGKHLSQVQVTFTRTNRQSRNGEMAYFKVIMEDVLVSSVRSRLPNQNDPQGADLGPIEDVAFSFGRITWIYTLPNGNTVRASWDVKANR